MQWGKVFLCYGFKMQKWPISEAAWKSTGGTINRDELKWAIIELIVAGFSTSLESRQSMGAFSHFLAIIAYRLLGVQINGNLVLNYRLPFSAKNV